MDSNEATAAIETKTPPHVLSAAIDFGTTYSGYAFSLKSNQKQIFCPQWKGANFLSLKTPTCLLFDSKENFHSFGYSAEEKYAELANEDYEAEWFYFRNFKMKLHSQEHPMKRNTLLTEEGGKTLSAMTVFSTSIRFLKDQVIKEKDKQGYKVKDNEIRWVITVPAIWDEEAKQFMREAAEEADIPTDQLILALEPEAASVFAKEMCVKRDQTEEDHLILSPYDPGTKFMVVDLGGGTVDITIREVLEDRTLKELYQACGNAKGGNTVNEEMYTFLKKIVGEDVFDEFCMTNKAAVLDLEKELESKKRNLDFDAKSNKIQINLPGPLLELYQARKGTDLMKSHVLNIDYAETVRLKTNKLRVSHTLFPEFFKSAGESIISNIRQILSNDFAAGLKDVILVGGFADSPIIRHSFEEIFSELTFKIPNDAGLAVLKGAVLYGHNPNVVSARVCRYTYGAEVLRYFLDGDDEEKKEMHDKVPYCGQVFHKLAEIGQTIKIGEKVTYEVSPIEAEMTKMTVKVYKSTEKDPKYVTDRSCSYIGKMVVDMPDTTGGLDRLVLVSLRFGDTELKLEAKDERYNKPVSVNLDMLS